MRRNNLYFVILISIIALTFSACGGGSDSEGSSNAGESKTDAECVAADKAALAIGFNGSDSESGVTQNITLPTSGSNGTTISWTSDAASYISDAGIVSRPDFFTGNLSITLTAKILKNSVNDSKIFVITVIKAPMTDEECVAADKAALVIGYNGSDSESGVKQDITLPTSGSSGTAIFWISDNNSVINNLGKIINPIWGSGDATVVYI